MDRSMENGDDSGCRDRECRVSSWEPMSMANADFRANVLDGRRRQSDSVAKLIVQTPRPKVADLSVTPLLTGDSGEFLSTASKQSFARGHP
jgi:hypothetical protein